MNIKNINILMLVVALVTVASATTFTIAKASSLLRSSTAAGASANQNTQLQALQTKANTEIDKRVTSLNSLLGRVSEMSRLTASEKAQLTSEIQANIDQMTTLKAKIDADTDAATLKTDLKSITKAYRVYALELPRGRIEAASDRITTLVSILNDLGAKLQVRITAAQTAGATNIASSQTAYADFQSKVADAQTQAQAAVALITPLVPDNGVASVMQSNEKTLKAAVADIKTAMTDLIAARKDISTIVTGLKINTNATTSATTGDNK